MAGGSKILTAGQMVLARPGLSPAAPGSLVPSALRISSCRRRQGQGLVKCSAGVRQMSITPIVDRRQLISTSNVWSSSREQTPFSLTKHCSPEGKRHKEKQGAKAVIQNFSNLNSLSLIFGVSKFASPRATAGRGVLFMG